MNRIYKKIAFMLSILTVASFVFGFILTIPIASAEGLEPISWSKIYDSHDISDIAYGNGIYVAVGADGIIKTSSDGLNWNIAHSDMNLLNSVVHGNGKFVAVGTEGTIYYSNDGHDWKKATSATNKNLISIAWNGNKFVAVADRGTILSSTDGVNWKSVVLETPYSFSKVVAGKGKFIATISDTFNLILTSEDGIAWTEVEPATGLYGYYNLGFNGEKFIMWGKVPHQGGNSALVSVDGVQWTKLENSPNFRSITSRGESFVGLDEDGVYISDYNLSWSRNEIVWNDNYSELEEIYYLSNKFIGHNYNGIIFTSTDGVNWTKESKVELVGYLAKLGISKDMLDTKNNIAFNGKFYVYVGGQSKVYGGEANSTEQYRETKISTDQMNWTTRRTDNIAPLKSVVWANDMFVAVGDEGTIVYSSNGTDWNNFIKSTSDDISKVIWNGEYYIAIGSNSILKGIRNICFNDIKGHWAEDIIKDAASRGIINGVDKNSFAPNKDISRAEFAAIIVRALKLQASDKSIKFSDVKASDWFYDEISAAYDNGILKGYGNNTIRPKAPITREEAMAIIERSLALRGISTQISEKDYSKYLSKFKDNENISSWAKGSAAACVKLNIFEGHNSTIRPKDNITRAEAAKIIMLGASHLIY